MTNQPLKFRRVHGRIIPIGERKGKVASGSGQVVAGLGVGATAGHAAASATKGAARFTFEAKAYVQKAKGAIKQGQAAFKRTQNLEKAGQMGLGMKIKSPKFHRFTKTALKSALKSKGLIHLNKGLKAGGLALSAGLIGHGLKEIYEGASGKKAGTKEDIISNAAGAGAAFSFHSAFARKMGIKDFLKYGLSKVKVR